MSVQKIRLLTLAYFVLAVAMRFLPHGVNFTAIGALALFAGCYLSATQGLLIGLGAVTVSDTLGHLLDWDVMGYYHRPTMLAVYACHALPSVIGWLIQKRVNFLTVLSGAAGSGVLFFLGTNFAAWLDPNMGFERSIGGLLQCYRDAIPFAYNHFASTVAFSLVFFGVYQLMARAATNARSQSQPA